jgi:uncharacterized membrane protein YcaP (DUF421 family)
MPPTVTGKELVINGEILQQNLSMLGISEQWLKQQLQTQGVTDIKKVTLATLTPDGKIYIDMEFEFNLKLY